MGDLRQARLREGATSGRCSPSASRSPRSLFWALLAAAAARLRTLTAARRDRSASRSARAATRSRPAATSPRSTGSTPRCCRCCSTPSPRWSRSAAVALGRERLDARKLAALGARLGRARRWWWRGPAPARSTRSAPALGLGRRRRLQRVHPRRARRSRRGSGADRAGGARLHRRRGVADARLAAARRAPPGRADAPPAGAGSRPRRRLDRRRDRPVLRRPAARRARRRRRSSPPSSRWSPCCSRSWRSARRSSGLQLAGGALVLAAVLALLRCRIPADAGGMA